ncbi:hypothetical protein [uncultured Tateyamaria sp.]|uniref:hypothetical protein n=1 Tax=uncultured Tateyamaria sp. TaxID=455651 RepID=UPI002616F1FC|nr:hypothetical protein [uncultured Tateyamaria sp.]
MLLFQHNTINFHRSDPRRGRLPPESAFGGFATPGGRLHIAPAGMSFSRDQPQPLTFGHAAYQVINTPRMSDSQRRCVVFQMCDYRRAGYGKDARF